MIETAAALDNLDESAPSTACPESTSAQPIWRSRWASMPSGALRHPEVLDAIGQIQRAATEAGLVTGIHASDGKAGRAMAQLGFQMITLAAESQALRRGAAEHLREAREQ